MSGPGAYIFLCSKIQITKYLIVIKFIERFNLKANEKEEHEYRFGV